MARPRPKIEVVEVTFAEPTGFERKCPWTEATKVLLQASDRLAAQSKQVIGTGTGDTVDTSTPIAAFAMDADVLISDFCQVAALSGITISSHDISYETLPAPHQRPKGLPLGKKGVYVFANARRCLKVGKVGPKSGARFTSQHYLPHSCQSNLAKSLLVLAAGADVARVGGDTEVDAEFAALTDGTVGRWIQQNTCRHHFFLSQDAPDALLNLLEVFLQSRLDPIFERG